ncbi:IclR family transcriptional regulator [Rhodococcus koreensis]
MAGNTSAPGASVAGRLLAVLDCYDTAHTELSLTEISERSGLPTSTAKRLIGELTAWGGLERLVDNKYRIGIRLWKIGSLAPQQRGLREVAVPLMHDLAEATHENVQLMVLDGLEVLCIEKISARTAVPSATEVGGRLPLHATAVGKCILANSPRELLVEIVERGLTRQTKHTIIQPGRLGTELREVRRTGVAYSREEMTAGVISVASPIIASGGILRGALGVVARWPGELERLAPAVRTTALTISRGCR